MIAWFEKVLVYLNCLNIRNSFGAFSCKIKIRTAGCIGSSGEWHFPNANPCKRRHIPYGKLIYFGVIRNIQSGYLIIPAIQKPELRIV